MTLIMIATAAFLGGLTGVLCSAALVLWAFADVPPPEYRKSMSR